MKALFAVFLTAHGLIHLLGVAKAFRLADLPQLTQPITPLFGGLWLIAALLHVTAALLLFTSPRWWWAAGAAAVVVSTVAIVPSWTDAKVGAAANMVVLAGVALGLFLQGPLSLRAQYEQEVDRRLAPPHAVTPVTDADLAHLPTPVQRYLRRVGVVGQPRVWNFRARMHGRIRQDPDSPWMPLAAEQHNFYDEPTRLFYMDSAMFRLPVPGLHRYVGPSATMLVKVLGLVPVASAAGPEMDRGETVTLFNDMCFLAPATLVDAAVTWEVPDPRTARGTFTNAGHTIRAELVFDEAGDLVNFHSDDRARLGADGTLRPSRWSTPLLDYRTFGHARLASRGEARYRDVDQDFAYLELTIDDVEYNVTRP